MSAWDIFLIIWTCGWLLTCVVAYHVMRGDGNTRRELVVAVLVGIALWKVLLVILALEWDWLKEPIGHKEDKEDK